MPHKRTIPRHRRLTTAKSRYKGNYNVSRIYYTKKVTYGAYIDYYDYHKIKITYKTTRDHPRKATEGIKRHYSMSRTRERLYRIIEANIGRHGNEKPIFFTLTSADQCTELKESNKKIKVFIRRLNTKIKKQIKYIIVPERHISGAIHYHGIFFNLPFIHIRVFRHEIWKYGYVDLQIPRHKIKSVALYLTKYLSKEQKQPQDLNQKSYFTSRGLYRPIEEFDTPPLTGTLNIVDFNIIKDGVKYKIYDATNNGPKVRRLQAG